MGDNGQKVAKAPEIHRMTRRCLEHDYRERCIYQITLVLADRASRALGRLEVRVGGEWVPVEQAKGRVPSPEAVEARVVPTALGAAIRAHWERLGEFTPEIRPLPAQLMPDHFHGILEVRRAMARPLGNAIGGFKTGCEKLYRKLALSTPDAPAAGSAPAAVKRLWAEGFQDTILRHAGQLDNMFGYLRDNPRRLAIKLLWPELFRVVGALRVAFKGAAGGAGACPVAVAPATGVFSALGNRFLLGRPLRQVQVSRRDFGYRRVPKPGGGLKLARDSAGEPIVEFSTPAFDKKLAELLAAARPGAALISPCVSDGERAIARAALAAGLPLVTLQNKGFSKLQKPSGGYFDACSDGRLLMLAPIAWPYVPGEKRMTREAALVMNRLAQLLAGEGTAEINYHGARLADIDRLAAEAVAQP